MMKSTVTIRPITPADNIVIAQIIRAALTEFGAAKPGTVYYDESTDRLSELFSISRSAYYIAEQNGEILGGAGIYPTEGLDHSTCELVKMYLCPQARGLGLGKMLMNQCIDFASKNGFTKIYLETLPELSLAIGLYEHMGFERLSAPLGASGHFGCGIWMAKDM